MESKEVKTESKILHLKGRFRQGFENKQAILCEFDGLIVTIANTTIGKHTSLEIAEANAENICRCLNAHEELVKALQVANEYVLQFKNRGAVGEVDKDLLLISEALKKAT